MAAVVIMRHFRPNEYAALLGKKKDSNNNKVDAGTFNSAIGTLLGLLLFWPAIAIIAGAFLFAKVILLKLGGGIVHKAFLAMDKLTPEVSIKFNSKDEVSEDTEASKVSKFRKAG
jgi:hypothetical protein